MKKEAVKVNKIVGINEVILEQFPDNRFDTVALLDIIKVIEKIKNDFKPDVVFTYYEHDMNSDQRITCNAVLTATRPLPDEVVKEVYSYETVSSAEFRYPQTFSPNIFFDISNEIDTKLNALKEYESEMRAFPHMRSLQGIELTAKMWDAKIGVDYAEPFICIRSVR